MLVKASVQHLDSKQSSKFLINDHFLRKDNQQLEHQLEPVEIQDLEEVEE